MSQRRLWKTLSTRPRALGVLDQRARLRAGRAPSAFRPSRACRRPGAARRARSASRWAWRRGRRRPPGRRAWRRCRRRTCSPRDCGERCRAGVTSSDGDGAERLARRAEPARVLRADPAETNDADRREDMCDKVSGSERRCSTQRWRQECSYGTEAARKSGAARESCEPCARVPRRLARLGCRDGG